jgi:hypothetical protein
MPHDIPVSPVLTSPNAAPAPPPEERNGELTPPPAANPRPFPNPSLRLDAGLGMVVLEFRDDLGEVTNSIPSQRILQAYRDHVEPPPAASGAAKHSNSAPETAAPPDRFA